MRNKKERKKMETVTCAEEMLGFSFLFVWFRFLACRLSKSERERVEVGGPGGNMVSG